MKIGDIIYTMLGVVVVFLLFYYWRGAVEVIRAGGNVLTGTLATLQGQSLPGRSFPTQYPQ